MDEIPAHARPDPPAIVQPQKARRIGGRHGQRLGQWQAKTLDREAQRGGHVEVRTRKRSVLERQFGAEAARAALYPTPVQQEAVLVRAQKGHGISNEEEPGIAGAAPFARSASLRLTGST